MNETEFKIDGMTCGNCARHVTDAIQAVPNVRSATVSLDHHNALVRWNGEKNAFAVMEAVKNAGFAAREADKSAPPAHDWQLGLWLGIFVTVFLISGEWIFQLPNEPWFQWTSCALAGLVQIASGAQFYRGAWRQLKVGASNMDTLVALGSTTAFGYSTWALLGSAGGHLYFTDSAAIITLISLGHWLEARASARAGIALKSLLNLAPQTATKISGQEIPVSELKIGDEILLSPGDRIPLDGLVIEGESAVDESSLTGESIPVEKKAADELFAGTVNLNGRIVMRITAMGEETALAHIIAAVQRAQSSRADIQRLGDRISGVFVPIVVLIAIVAGLWWGLAPASANHVHSVLEHFFWHGHVPAGIAAGFIVASSVLIIACPCAMGLATPIAIMAGANAAARRGILIRDGVALERAGNISVVVLDKTGTLTSGNLAVTGPWTPDNCQPTVQKCQKLAASLARPSNHPISKALASYSCDATKLNNWREISGSGIQAELSSEPGGPKTVRLGSLPWLESFQITAPSNEMQLEQWKDQGATLVGLAEENSIIGIFALKDYLKADAARVVWQLQRQGLKTYLLTGDNPRTASAIANEIGIPLENVLPDAKPEQKAEFIKKLQASGERVAFVGDGINDAPALTQANLGIAVSHASDIAREAADIILLKAEISGVSEAIGLAQSALRTIKQNLFWAFFYNMVGIPIAALGFVSPIYCAAAMGASDLIVIGNALLLLQRRRFSS